MRTEERRGTWWRAILLMGMIALAGLGCAPGPDPAPERRPLTTEAGWRASREIPPWDERDDLRLLYVELKLRENTIAEDVATVNALHFSKGIFTHLIIVAPSWQERPDAARNPIVLEAFEVARRSRLGVFWGRWLWVGWPDHELEDPLPGPTTHLDATFYAAAISTIRAEARLLGAVGTFFDAEPYGASEQKETLKKKKLGPEDRLAISAAIDEATQYAGQVDLIYPTSSSRASHYSWPLEGLGRFRCGMKAFYQKESSGKIVANPPEGYRHVLDFWGSFVTVESRQIGGATSKSWTLTTGDADALDLDVIRERFSECRGFWVYSDEPLPVLLKEWGS